MNEHYVPNTEPTQASQDTIASTQKSDIEIESDEEDGRHCKSKYFRTFSQDAQMF